ncbi:TIGR00268 family protein [Saccharopolyspora subtropica]|uniref:ATP-dependent sacrificial sulfur transferase LarE n=1 Tax=Saccharopolyspora thermophila TaxID=89367 RepID=A0A917JVU1_9PSEU|nr:ATP-dependent sacrificial sulfur transferase LarE [Saccharopolyspora subtropica]GGI88581.1 TIGR00268 family protein [Saccharopolyspora subtropica]
MSVPELDRLRHRLSEETALVVAFSGGVDSALLAAVAHEALGARMLAVTAVSPSLAASERRQARQFARDRGIPHVEVCTDEADRPEYAANDGNRCYHCKSALFDAVEPLAAAMGARVALGTNLDDLGDHRPGQQAAAQRGAIAPLVDAGLTKAAVRLASQQLGLSTADKPAAACLASRVAYGDPVTPEVLGRIERAEEAVHRLGFEVCRVRAHGRGSVARLELPATDIERAAALHDELDRAVRDAGFRFCSLDLAGFRSGRMNALLPLLPMRTAS